MGKYKTQNDSLLLSFLPVPVIRPQDLAVKGIGTLQLLDRKLEPLRITGTGTRFFEQLQPHYQISLPNGAGQAEVVQVLSDTELLIKKEFKDLKALALLSEGSPFKCIPHVDQDAVYRCVHDQLNQNQCITIFPEGGSHDRAELLPLKGNHKVNCILLYYPLFANDYLTLFILSGSWCDLDGPRRNGQVSRPRCQDRPMW